MLNLNIEFNSFEDLKTQLVEIQKDLENQTIEPKKSKTKKSKIEDDENEPEQLEPKDKEETILATKEKVYEALKNVSSKYGMEAAKKVLSQFNCARVSEVRPEQFDAFIKSCQSV